MREQAYSEKNEKLNKKLVRYIHELASEKGKDNLTIATFCQQSYVDGHKHYDVVDYRKNFLSVD